MGSSTKIRVMLSSRCNDPFPEKSATKLSDIRRSLKKRLRPRKFWGAPSSRYGSTKTRHQPTVRR